MLRNPRHLAPFVAALALTGAAALPATALAAARSPQLTLHVSHVGRMITVTTSVAPGAQGHYAVGATGDGLGNWAVVGSTEKFTGIAPGDWTLTVTWTGIDGWSSTTVTKTIAIH